jgi:hypothetical protein
MLWLSPAPSLAGPPVEPRWSIVAGALLLPTLTWMSNSPLSIVRLTASAAT